MRGLGVGSGLGSRLIRAWLVFVMAFGLLGYRAVQPTVTAAAPALSVSTTVSRPLLGGTATVRVTATNTGDTKGYNLSIDALFGSSLPDPGGTVTISDSSEPPTSQSLDPATGDRQVTFYDLVDLAPGESHTFTIELDLSGDSSWEVNDLLTAQVSAQLNEFPDNSGVWLTGYANADAPVIPIKLVTKTANQSTGVAQATGTTTRPYSYTIDVANNLVNPSESVLVTDTVPDGVEFLGVTSGPALDAGFPARDPQTGETHLQWSLGTMAPGATEQIVYAAGIRYDFFGTDNDGTNRAHDDFSSQPATAAIVANKTDFTNTARLSGVYTGSLPEAITLSDTDTATVQGAYVTIAKAGSPTVGGHGTVIDYTLRYVTSEYYSADSNDVLDTLPDGMTYVPGSASPAPTSVTQNADGTTDLTWIGLPAMTTTDSGTITFQATVDTTWEQPGIAGEPVRAGDSMTNIAEKSTVWTDEVKPWRSGPDLLVAQVSAGLSTRLPGITKHVWDPEAGSWTDHIDAQVGDELLYRLRFNTTDGATPERSDIALGYITLTDWLPPGTVYNNDAVPSHDGTFSVPTTGTPPSVNPDVPSNVSLGSLQGLEWFLGDVSPDGWWETTFTATVADVPAVAQGLKTGNHWKLTGINTFGREYSDRAIATLDYVEPELTLVKDVLNAPSPVVGGSVVRYSVTIESVGLGESNDVLIRDTLPQGMRATTPTIVSIELDGAALTAGVDYDTTYNAGTGVWDIDLHTASVDTPIPAGSEVVIHYDSSVDAGAAAGRTLTNLATASYNTQPDGSGRAVPGTSNTADPNTDDASVQLAPLQISKSWPTGPYRVGETATASIEVVVPPGLIAYYPRIVDTFNRDGVYYVPGSAAMTQVSGTPVVPASFDTTSAPVRGNTTTNNSTTLRWDLANPIDNTGQASAYTFRLSWDMQYTAVRENGTQEFWQPTATDRVTNTSAVASWGTTNTATRDRSATYNPSGVYTDIDQPRLVLDKTTTTSGPYAGGSPIGYQVVLSNNGWAPAYDLDWLDVLPTYLGSPSLVSITHSTLGDISGSVTSDFTTAPNMTIDFNGVSLAPGQTITIRYSATVDPDVPAAATLTNASDVDWSSLPGTPAGSRRYDDQPWESAYVADSDSVSVTVASPTIVKSVLGPDPARIGDEVSYRLRVTVPAETVLPGSYLSDAFVQDGTSYVAGSARTELVSGSPQTSATVGTVTFDPTLQPGASLRFDLTAPVDNSDSGAAGDTPYVFDLLYAMRVDGLDHLGGWAQFVPTATDAIDDTARLHWTVGGTPRTVSSSASHGVDQPLLRLTKSEVSTGPYEGGETVSYRTVIENVGWATAYDLSWDDLFAPDLSGATLTAVTHSDSGDILGSVAADFSGDDTATIGFGAIALDPGDTITVDYDVVVDPGAGSGAQQINTADVDWSTLPGSVPGERVFNDSAAESAWTADTDTALISVASAQLVKSVVGGDSTRTIGEEFEYDISFSIPASTTAYDVALTDTVPDGLTVLSATGSAPVGTILVGAEAVNGTTPVLWSLGAVANPPYATLMLTLRVRVDDTFASGVPLDGLPAGVDGDPQTVIDNSATLTWDDRLVGGTTRTSTDNAVVTVVEPALTIDKAASRVTMSASDTVTYTATLSNEGVSDAHEVRFDDVVPGELFSSGSSPQLVSVELDGAPLTAGVDYTASFGAGATSTLDLAVPVPAGSDVVIVYTATLNGGAARGMALTNTARVAEYRSLESSATGERVYGPITDTATVTARAPEASLDKSLVGDAQLQAGQHATFRLEITNSGDATGYSVVVTDTLPAGLTYVPGSTTGTLPGIGAFSADPVASGSGLVWDFGGALDLTAGQTATFDFRASVDSSASLGLLTNNAETALVDGGGVPVVPATDSQQVRITKPDVVLVKSLRSGQDAFVQVGETVSFDLAITNTGSTALATVPLTDTYDPAVLSFASATPVTPISPVPGTLSWADVTGGGSLAVGATITITVEFDVVGHPASSTTTNTGQVAGATDQYGDTAPSSTSSATVGVTAPAVTVNKTLTASQAATVSAGDTVTFDIGVTNSGDTTLTTVRVRDLFEAGVFEFVSATPAADSTMPSGTVVWNDITATAGDLAPSQTETVTITLLGRHAAHASVDTAAVLSATDINGDPATLDSDTASASVAEPVLSIDKSADSLSAGPGDTVTYSVIVANTGTGAAHDIVIHDEVPAPLWPINIDRVELDGAVLVSGVDFTVATPTSMEPEIRVLVPLPAGSELEVVYTAELAGGTPVGSSLTNTAQVIGTSLPGAVATENWYGPLFDTWTLVTRAPALGVTKSVVGDTELQHGQNGRYRVVVTNTGDAPARSVVVTDALPAGLEYVSGSTEATWGAGSTSMADPTDSAGVLGWTFGGAADLEPGESLALEFEAAVAPLAELGLKTNVAVVAGVDGGGVPIAPVLATADLLVTLPVAGVEKRLATGQDPFVQVGEQVTFDFVIRNSGDTTIAVLPMSEVYDPTYLSYVTGSATVTPDSAVAGALGWTDLTTTFGDFEPGRVETVTVTFEAIAHPSSSWTEDSVSIAGALDTFGDPVPVVGDTAGVSITAPSVSINKVRTSASPTSPGETVTFDVGVTNAGDTTLTVVPVADTFDDTVLSFSSATVTPTTVTSDSLGWSDVTTALGDIAPGVTATMTVNFVALDTVASTINTVAIPEDAAVDINSDVAGGVEATAGVDVAQPALTMGKTADSVSMGPGETARYTVTLTNVSTVPIVGARVVDVIPAHLGMPFNVVASIDGTALSGSDVTIDADSPLVVEFGRDIAPGSYATIEYDLTLAGGTLGGQSLENTASVEWSSAGGVGYGPLADTHAVTTREPVLTVDKVATGDLQVQRGQETSFTITVRNEGDAPAYSVVVTDTIPTGLSYVSGSATVVGPDSAVTPVEPVTAGQEAVWSLPLSVLNPGESLTIRLSLSVDADAATGMKNNVANAQANDGGGAIKGPVTSADTILVTDPSVTVTKGLAVGQDEHIQVGETVLFDIEVMNDGSTDIETLPLSDTFDAAYLEFVGATPAADATSVDTVSWNDITGNGMLAPGDATVVTVEFRAIAHPPTSSTSDVAAVEGAVDEYGDPVPIASDTAEIAITAPSVSVRKVFTDTERSVYQRGTPISFDIGVTNTGDTVLASIPLTDTFDPALLTYVSATLAPDSVAAGSIGWSDITVHTGDLAPSQTATLTVVFTASGVGSGVNVATIDPDSPVDIFGDTATGDQAERPYGVYEAGQVAVDKTADPVAGTVLLPGDIITYTVSLANNSPLAIPDVLLADELPDSVTYVAGSMRVDAGDGTLVPVTDAPDADSGRFASTAGPRGTVFAALPQVPAQSVAKMVFSVSVRPEEFSRQGVRNVATVTSAGDPVGTTGPVDHPVDPIEITKEAEDVNGGRLKAGDQIEWTITVRNTGLIPTTNVVVTDTVPDTTRYVKGSISGRGADDADAPDLVWRVGNLRVDESVTLTFRSTVKSGLKSGTTIRNQAVVTSDQSRPKRSDAPETAEVGDPTLLQTGGNDWIWIGGVISLLFAAAASWGGSRRLRRG